MSAWELRALPILSEMSESTVSRTTPLQTWMSVLPLARAMDSWKAKSASLKDPYPPSTAARICSMAASISASCASVRSTAASRLAVESSIILDTSSCESESSSARARRRICLVRPPVVKGRISGPFGSPGRERTTPLLSSTRSASRTVARLVPNCTTSSRSLGRRCPGRSSPRAIASSTCSTMRS